ncbi:response regulator [Bacillus taeanensis]|uniref:DNA-binding response regulator n=1 Tax=Bacillus taeanensis TaxID=273032 RepID=A0A366XSW9_9BACI|nr:response regulator transcription factor [Bacillus taeanensis]RBW68245.1 DNA-binding response regulator [Bacillus taeanensis]
MDKIRLMIVEDDPVWMQLLSEYIGKEVDITVVYQAYTKEKALEVSHSDIDVVLLDLTLSEDQNDLSGIDVASQLYDKGLMKIIMLTSWDEEEIILESFDKGAMNYVTKTSYKDIPMTVREAYEGKVSLHSDVSSTVLNNLRKERKAKVLTPAEREVYDLKEKGLNKRQIAEKLFKSVETIKKHLKMIKGKIN